MKIAVLSDIHDDIDKLSSVLDKVKEENCEMLFALGDYTSPKAFKVLANVNIPIYAVFGNMDQENDNIESWVRDIKKDITLRREMNRVQVEDFNYALTHYPEIAEKLLKSGMYRAVFYGHTHKATQKSEDDTLLANPGAVKDGSFGIYDLTANKFRVVKV
jgi:uncharacterized protein